MVQVKNEDVHGSSPISSLFVHDFWGQDISSGSSHKSYRPLTVLTYRLDFLLYGLDAYGYHITNVVVYCFSCVLLYFAAKLWIGQQGSRTKSINANSSTNPRSLISGTADATAASC